MNRPCFLAAGGDSRTAFTAQSLADDFDVYTYKVSGADGCIPVSEPYIYGKKADVLCLPMMTRTDLFVSCNDGSIAFDSLVNSLKDGALVTGGRLSTEQIEYFSALGYDVADYFSREELVIRNCIPTAEGALMLAMENTEKVIASCRVVITGFGRVAAECARLFSACNAECVIAARKPEARAKAENMGLTAVAFGRLCDEAMSADVVINTVPHCVLDRKILQYMRGDCVIIDLASKPGGVDFDYAERVGIKAIFAPGLPSKVAPRTSGEIIASAIKNILSERGIYDAV